VILLLLVFGYREREREKEKDYRDLIIQFLDVVFDAVLLKFLFLMLLLVVVFF